MKNSENSSYALKIAAFAAVYVIWGSTYLSIRFAIETIPPFLMVGARFVIAGSILFAWAIVSGARKASFDQWKNTFIIGFLLLLCGNGMVVLAEQKVASSITALLITIEPIWIVLIQWVRKEVRPRVITWLGIGFGLLGIAFLSGPKDIAGINHVDPFWAFMLMLSTLSWATGSLYSVKANLPSSGILNTGMQMLCGGFLLLICSIISGECESFNFSQVSLRSLGALGYLIIFGSIIGFSSYLYLVKVAPPNKVSTYAYVNPLIAVVLGTWLGNETMTVPAAIAAILLITAVALVLVQKEAKSDGTKI